MGNLAVLEKIVFTESAFNDLDNIKHYIYNDNENAARNVAGEILNKIDLLLTSPNIGRAGRVLRTRELIIAKYPYIVPYQVRNNTVYILRVLHTSRKW